MRYDLVFYAFFPNVPSFDYGTNCLFWGLWLKHDDLCVWWCSWLWRRILKLLSLRGWKVFNLVRSRNSKLELIYLLFTVCYLVVSSIYFLGLLNIICWFYWWILLSFQEIIFLRLLRIQLRQFVRSLMKTHQRNLKTLRLRYYEKETSFANLRPSIARY